MIGLLRGAVLRASPESMILDVEGVGYAVRIPLSTYYEVEQRGEGSTVELLIHTHVREGAIELFGFLTDAEKVLFEKLIAVSGIGPRLAQVILSGMSPRDLLAALGAGDVARLTRIPGIGKKTAERLVLELREAAELLAVEIDAEAPPANEIEADLVGALVNLGYRAGEAERAVRTAVEEQHGGEFPELLRRSLKRLSRL